ncbi:hypothetical protein ACWGJ2_18000 [Streptomyces sp. NPDC054796]
MTNRRRPNQRLRSLLSEADWTQEALARAVNALGSEIGSELHYDRTAVAHWLSGTQPRRPVPELVAEALSRRVDRTITPESAGFSATAPEPRGADPVSAITSLSRSDADAPRRVRLQQRPYRLADAKVPPRPATLSSWYGRAGPAAPSPRALALHDAVRFFASSIDAHGGRNGRSALAAYLADDVGPLLRARARHPDRPELLRTASRLSFLLARMYEDGQLHGLAQHCYTHAHRLAAEAGDRADWGLVLRAMGTQARRLGHIGPGLRLAEAAAEAVRTASPPRRAYVQAELAVVRARSGDRRGALAALSAAEYASDRSGGHRSAHRPQRTRGANANSNGSGSGAGSGSAEPGPEKGTGTEARTGNGTGTGIEPEGPVVVPRRIDPASGPTANSTAPETDPLPDPPGPSGPPTRPDPPEPHTPRQQRRTPGTTYGPAPGGALRAPSVPPPRTASRAEGGALPEPTADGTQTGGGPFDVYSPAALSFQVSLTLEALGDLSGALSALGRSRAERQPADVRGHALSQARMGRLLLRCGRLDDACAAWHGFLDGYVRLRSGEAEQAIQGMRRALTPYRSRGAVVDLLARALPGGPDEPPPPHPPSPSVAGH